MSNDAICVNNITKVYKLYSAPKDRMKEALSLSRAKFHRKFFALNGISFSVKKGECVGIVGRNGCGKSTILKILTGVLTPTTGSCTINGKISALLELGAGFNQEYTGIENIYLNGSIMGISREEMSARLDRIIGFADIGDFIHQPVKSYSSGMFVRLAFAVAIHVDPDILIVDEALSVGDVFFQQKCYAKFNEFKESGKTILFVSHDTNSIIQYCSRAILMDHGAKVSEGSPKDIVDLYKQYMTGAVAPETEEQTQAASEEQFSVHMASDILVKNWFSINPSMLEYGDKKAEIVDFGILDENRKPTLQVEKNRPCTLYMKVCFHETISNPIFAYAIKDIKGLELTGSNTQLEGIKTDTYRSGNMVEVHFTQPVTLQGGPFFLSFGCTTYDCDGNIHVFHRLYDVIVLDVISSKVSTGFFDLNSDVRIVDLN